MSEIEDEPVRVTGYEERRHWALRKLARACIELARLRLEKKNEVPIGETGNTPTSPEQEAGND